ncbi:hypothetical protein MLD38_040065 [Melastoma candidum]|uniref:Uncharacterized protein n=1 Tax=Melastoma candidum TaxID=119954 RepID=A0ACB9L4J9_9MYRT|nr:hypothetical protein MLD38_040065 [Melastoma candidum]
MSEYPSKPAITTDGAMVLNLYCPQLSQSLTLLVPSGRDGKVDVGAVSRAFGLDPSTIRINGHYLSRGPDLVSRSVTWAALLGYFSSKGLPSGSEDNGRAVVVEGKPLRIGSKRGCEDRGVDGRIFGDGDFVHKRLRRTNSAHPSSTYSEGKEIGGTCSKRKCLLEDMSLLKRLKINDASVAEDQHNREVLKPPSSDIHYVCRVIGENMKRVRDDNPIAASPLKRVLLQLGLL